MKKNNTLKIIVSFVLIFMCSLSLFSTVQAANTPTSGKVTLTCPGTAPGTGPTKTYRSCTGYAKHAIITSGSLMKTTSRSMLGSTVTVKVKSGRTVVETANIVNVYAEAYIDDANCSAHYFNYYAN